MTERNPKGGRKPLVPGERTVITTIRLTIAQKAKFRRLGSGAWLRRKLDEEGGK